MSVLSLLAQQAPEAVSAVTETTFDVPANVVFAVMAVFMIAAAIRVVTTKNIVHAALWLVIVLGGVGINYLLLQAEFVAITQFLVYLGAIIVLFLFGIMLTRAPLGVSDDLDNNQRWIGLGAAALLLVVVGYARQARLPGPGDRPGSRRGCRLADRGPHRRGGRRHLRAVPDPVRDALAAPARRPHRGHRPGATGLRGTTCC
jgi:uncharacterized MnhB-related membrane protein